MGPTALLSMSSTQLFSAGNPGENDPPLCWLSKIVTAYTHSETALAMPAPCHSSSCHISMIVLHTVKSTAEIPLTVADTPFNLIQAGSICGCHCSVPFTHVAMVNKHITKIKYGVCCHALADKGIWLARVCAGRC